MSNPPRDDYYLPANTHETTDVPMDEERKGLLSGEQVLPGPPEPSRGYDYEHKRSLGRYLVYGAARAPLPAHHVGNRTVLIVSIDGLRADYLDRGFTPHLLDISKLGLRAKYMKPIFPTLTFPNHWALMTGLHAESHGIVANNFWDAETDSEFHYNREAICWKPHWWFGEPDKVPLQEKLDQIMEWIDLPLEKRPQLIMAYEPSLDQAGHAAGPYSALVNDTLRYVDTFAKDLHTSLVTRNLTDIVDIVFVSDHGMTDTSHPELVYMDDILGADGWAEISHEDGWPAMGLHFKPAANVSHYLDILLNASAENSEKFAVYTPETMPERYHFADNPRIAPIYVVPNIGYVLTTHAEGDVGVNKGSHGYDNNESPMHAMFVAHGPFSAVAKAVQQSNARQKNSEEPVSWAFQDTLRHLTGICEGPSWQ
ncbi:hypothetical protein EWM64_g6306 [Hericium alpestre]|uniref:Phosphodiest-domain-containing protein n=1 Tax=Hericium alpestre TaxID=135208 RepID=A0A4Y9ZT10_9AGAM|nr:hypothetical protein EWM64_g6306 [Hericium alpestre]